MDDLSGSNGDIDDALRLAANAGASKPLPMRFGYGQRYNSQTDRLDAADPKGIGFRGPVSNGDHIVSEYSTDRDFQYPSVYSGISDADLASILTAERMHMPSPADVDQRAYTAAKSRVNAGRSPFYEQGRDPYPAWSPNQHWDAPAVMPSRQQDRLMYADGGEVSGSVSYLPEDQDHVANAMRVANEPTMQAYEPTIKERIANYFMGDERPSPERRQFANGLSDLAGFIPGLGNVMQGQEAYRAGDTKGMALAAIPLPGASKEAAIANAARVARGASAPVRAAYERKLSPLGFYSAGAEHAYNLPQETGSVAQMRAMLEKSGTKPAEFEWSGFDRAFPDPKAKVTRDDLVRHFESNVPQLNETRLTKGHEFPAMSADQWQAEIARAERIGDFDYADRLTRAWEASEGHGGAGEAKFEKYTLPGGSDYRESLLHLPVRDPEAQAAAEEALRIRAGGGRAYRSAEVPTEYRSSHWDVPNVVAHTRSSTRDLPDGGKAYHLEESQSDWGQEARKKGVALVDPEKAYSAHIDDMRRRVFDDVYKDAISEGMDAEKAHRFATRVSSAEDVRTLANYLGEQEQHAAALNERISGRNKIPNAPYIGNTQGWTDLNLKRALYEAAQAGHDRFAWTPGVDQAARYDLSKQISELYHWRDGEHIGLSAYDPNGSAVLDQHLVKPENLDNVVGKEMADKILKGEGEIAHDQPEGVKVFRGQDLSVGGEGMKSYYDKMLPSRLKEVLKQIERNPKFEPHDIGTGRYEVVLPNGRVVDRTNTIEDAHNQAKFFVNPEIKPETKQLPALALTPEMREKILKGGFPYFMRGGTVDDHVDAAMRVAKGY
jgi:hypothetical protein